MHAYRSHTCADLDKTNVGDTVRLAGWVHRVRDHGGVLFIDLRDHYGITQVLCDSDSPAFAELEKVRSEWCIRIDGSVKARDEGLINPKIPTGEIEVIADDLVVLNRSQTVPFEPDSEEAAKVSEETRLRYRYIDLRRASMARNLRLRHAICQAMRRVLDGMGFTEVETPFLTKSTPEGARDFLVPSRLQLGDFYALPQSPQLFKQILMVAGLDKYYQIVRCFRDEDLRADRQPEFTQLDVEMSFATEVDVMAMTDAVFREICQVAGKGFPEEVPTIPYAQAMDRYGIDCPDMRFEMLLSDVSDIVAGSDFKVFSGAIERGGVVKGLCAPGGAKFTRKEIDQYTAHAGDFGAKGLAWCKLEADGFVGGVAKFLDASTQSSLRERFGAADGDILMFVADAPEGANKALAALRSKLGAD
ncbi:hypothetical protein LCGC14_2213470, partial [marine sediment metagenome]